MNKTISIGSRVITRKFNTTKHINFSSFMEEFINKEGVVTNITELGDYCVHGFTWPPSAIELITSDNEDTKALNKVITEMNKPVFQPEYGKEYEFSDDKVKWESGQFYAMNLRKPDEFIAVLTGTEYIFSYRYCRPIRRTLEDEIKEWVNQYSLYEESKRVLELLSIIATHQPDVTEPTDIDILEYHNNNGGNIIVTTRHFLKQGI